MRDRVQRRALSSIPVDGNEITVATKILRCQTFDVSARRSNYLIGNSLGTIAIGRKIRKKVVGCNKLNV